MIIASSKGAADTRAMIHAVHEGLIPNNIILSTDGGDDQKQLPHYLPSA